MPFYRWCILQLPVNVNALERPRTMTVPDRIQLCP